MDAIQFLKQEHEKAKAAFGKVLKAAPETRGQLWADVFRRRTAWSACSNA